MSQHFTPIVSFRRLQLADLPLVAHWQSQPHVARWWRAPANLESITNEYLPQIEGRDPTEVFLIELDGEPVGVIQRYLLANNPEWAAAIRAVATPPTGLDDAVIDRAAGIDYYLGEERLIGQGIGSHAIASFTNEVLARYPTVALVVAAPQQDNIASWRALEKAGFERIGAGQLNSDDPSDAGPAYVYGRRRPSPPTAHYRSPAGP